MREYIVHLIPESNFEIIPHSDTIFGAICWAIRTLFGKKKLKDILKEFWEQNPPFLLSSTFPYKQIDNERIYYLPKPYIEPLSMDDLKELSGKVKIPTRPYHKTENFHFMHVLEKYKKFKKLKWIPYPAFKKVQNGAGEKELFQDFLDGLIREPNITRSIAVQKNRLDRLSFSISGSGETFFQIEQSFMEGWGLYFLVKTNNLDEYLKPVFMYLQDSGIGPDTKTGKNWFKAKISEKSLIENNLPSNKFITLSRYIGIDEIDIQNSRYGIESVRSKVESRFEFAGEDIWKAQVMYFSPGSLIKLKEQKPYYGGLLPVKKIKGETIYQYGYAYPAYIQEKKNNED